MLKRSLQFLLDHKLISFLIAGLIIIGGTIVAPFHTSFNPLPGHSLSIDALPNIGENQQIIFTKWPGQSPQDVEDQISYPLTTFLLGLPGVTNVRSNSLFGFSSIYLTFEEELDFYWCRSPYFGKIKRSA